MLRASPTDTLNKPRAGKAVNIVRAGPKVADTGKVECLVTDCTEEYGHPIFAYFSGPDSASE